MSSGAVRLGPGMATTMTTRMRKRRGVVGVVVASARDCCCGGGDDGGKGAVVAVESKTWQGISSGRYGKGGEYSCTIGSFTVLFLSRSYL
jgi:hypothetical protein